MIPDSRYIYDIVEIGGRALEFEDRFMIGCTTVRSELYGEEEPRGLLRLANERYYQFVVSRALLSNYAYHVGVERGTHDFVISAKAGEKSWLAVGEMKKWFSSVEEAEMPGMRADIQKLQRTGGSAFFLVVTFWPPDDGLRCLRALTAGLRLQHSDLIHHYSFRTISWAPETVRDFALVGFRVK